MKYSIVIPTCSAPDNLIKPCLESVLKHSNHENIEVIVVTNGCPSETIKYLNGIKDNVFDISIIQYEDKIGYTKATNRGIKESKGDYVILLNDDTVLMDQQKNEWLEILEKPFIQDGKTAVTGPSKIYSPPANKTFIVFFCAMIKRKLFREIGMLNEIFTPGGGEDTDFCIRAENFGYKTVQVPCEDQLKQMENTNKLVGNFPIFHEGEQSVHKLENWENVFSSNSYKLSQMYNHIVKSNDFVIQDKDVTVVIPTRNRYFDTLPLTIQSIISQTYKPKTIIIFDDGDKIDLREKCLYQHLFSSIQQKGIEWKVLFGEGKGQVLNHQQSIESAETEFIWRVDDDECPEPDTLEKLIRHMSDEKVGAVAGLVLDPKNFYNTEFGNNANKIKDIRSTPNIQWFKNPLNQLTEVEHLYSSFLFRKEAAQHGYCTQLSQIGHREETIFTYEMHLKGWKLLVDPEAVTWHYRSDTGGLRNFNDAQLWEHDENIFDQKMKLWGLLENKPKLCVVTGGIGDTIAFSTILPEIIKKYKNVIVASYYPEVFEDFKDKNGFKFVRVEEAKMLYNRDLEDFNIYVNMINWQWDKHIIDAYRKLYGVES